MEIEIVKEQETTYSKSFADLGENELSLLIEEFDPSKCSPNDKNRYLRDAVFNNDNCNTLPGIGNIGQIVRPSDDHYWKLPDSKRYYFYNGEGDCYIQDKQNFISLIRKRIDTFLRGDITTSIRDKMSKDPNYNKLYEDIGGNPNNKMDIYKNANRGLYIVDYKTIMLPSMFLNSTRPFGGVKNTEFLRFYNLRGDDIEVSPDLLPDVLNLIRQSITNNLPHCTIRTITFIPDIALNRAGISYLPSAEIIVSLNPIDGSVVHPLSKRGEEWRTVYPSPSCIAINVNDNVSNSNGYWIKVGNRVEKVINNRDPSKPNGAEISIYNHGRSQFTKRVNSVEDFKTIGLYNTVEEARNNGVHPDTVEEIERRAKEAKALADLKKQEHEEYILNTRRVMEKEKFEMESAIYRLRAQIEFEAKALDLEINRIKFEQRLMETTISTTKAYSDLRLYKDKLSAELEILEQKKRYDGFKNNSDFAMKVLSVGERMLTLV